MQSYMVPIGKVIHYYGKPGVAIVRLERTLSVGDRVRFERGEEVFDQEVSSIHKEYQPVERAGKGEEVGVKTAKRVKEGALVCRMEDGEG